MAKNDNLKDFLVDVADAIREKKGTTDKINPQDFSSEIASIQSRGRDWSEIGYDAEPSFIEEGFAYAKEIKENWDESTPNFKGDLNLMFFPNVPFTTKRSAEGLFSGCTRLVRVDNLPFDLFTDTTNTFSDCVALCKLPLLNMINNTKLWYTFLNCYSLKELHITNSSKITYYSNAFNGAKRLTYINEIDMSSASTSTAIFRQCENLVFCLIKNLGKSTLATYPFDGATNWGVATTDIPDARQSLIDSLITYSYDRAANGLPTATIQLSATTKGLLTEEEIAQITAKGYTIA